MRAICVGIVFVVLLGGASADQLYFTSRIYSNYAHSVAQKLVQQLHASSQRTVGQVHLSEVRDRNGNSQLVLWLDGRRRLNYPYSLGRIHSFSSAEEIANRIYNRLVSDKKVFVTKR